MVKFRNLHNPVWVLRYLGDERIELSNSIGLTPAALMAFSRAAGIYDGAPATITSAWWLGGEMMMNRNVYAWDPEDSAFYVGAALFAKRQDKGLLRMDNLGLGSKIPKNLKHDLIDFGSIAGAVIHKALSGLCFDYLDEWGWDFHRVQAKESETRLKARKIAEQLIYLDVMSDIEGGLNKNGFDT